MVQVKKIKVNEAMFDRCASLYYKVWQMDLRAFKERMMKHATYEGFRGFYVTNSTRHLVGFAYGYTSLSGQYYRKLLESALTEQDIQQWLEDCFEVAELAVHPMYRRKGIGRALLEQLLDGLGHKTAILTTQLNNIPARTLYELNSWVIVKEPFYPIDIKDPFVIMGKLLK
ncbi:N-acetyltransferase [Pullulanibacillus camelliae]|uniref:N-acetyltransferase n=1 Tax=Pullulanibacillus camelliae TaxID=1707096 RepID=A0A8J2YP24_9BACL|nr:GNAT family N-acetyltransferase [Pullulanibacillus camelliae]GGE55518.1 N-acetyltransferase [Pullulanibacillus camelliae]